MRATSTRFLPSCGRQVLVEATLVTIRSFHRSAKFHTLSSTSICPTEDEHGDQDSSVFGWQFSFHAEGVETSEIYALCGSWTIARDATYFDADEGRDERNARPWIAISWTHASARDAIEHVRPRKSASHALRFRSRTMSSLPRLVSPIPAPMHLRLCERTLSPSNRDTRTAIGPCRLPLLPTRSSHVSFLASRDARTSHVSCFRPRMGRWACPVDLSPSIRVWLWL